MRPVHFPRYVIRTGLSGHLDEGENALQAAARETKEEAGLEMTDLEVVQGFEEKLHYPVNGKPKDVIYYLARLINGEQKIHLSDEHQNFIWAKLPDACQLVKYNDTQSVLRKAEEFLKESKSKI